MHVNGSRHRRAIVRLCETARLSETAPLLPWLRAAMAELLRTADDDALFAKLLRNAEDDVALRVPAHAPWLARRSLVHRVTRMTCHAPVRTGGAVGAGWDLD